MLPRHYESQNCSIARALEVLGDRWTILVIRDAFLGLRRFEDFQRDLGIARNVLTDRLTRLVEEGVLERRRYQERPERFEYRLTDKGKELWPVTMALLRWGDHHYAAGKPPRVIRHRGCGGGVTERLRCDSCGADLDLPDVEAVFGPGAKQHQPGEPVDQRPAAA